MRRIEYLMALAIMFSMIGWAYAATIDMPGGTQVWVADAGGSYGYAHSFIIEDPTLVLSDFVEADILAVASTDGIGMADVKTTVPNYVYLTIEKGAGGYSGPAGANPGGLDDAHYKVMVGAQGETKAHVESTDPSAHVTVASQIGAFAHILEETNDGDEMDDVIGAAYIKSGIGKDWLPYPLLKKGQVGPLEDDFQMGYLDNVPEGKFIASGYAVGKADYLGELWNNNPTWEGVENHAANYFEEPDLDDANDPVNPDLGDPNGKVEGGVDGLVTIGANVGTQGANIAGFIEDIDEAWDELGELPGMLDDAQIIPEEISAALYLGGPFYHHELWSPDVAVAELAAGSYSDTDPFSAAGTISFINVAAQNGFTVGSTSVGGTIEGGTAHALAVTNWYDYGLDTLNANARQDNVDANADVRVYKELDEATAHTLLADGAFSGSYTTSVAGSIADTFSAATRSFAVDPVDDPNGLLRTWGRAFITQGTWNANAAEFYSDYGEYPLFETLETASVSGKLAKVQHPDIGDAYGMGSGTFLQNLKTYPAFANMRLLQGAASDIGTATVGLADTRGPMSQTLGSSEWDGAGVYAGFNNLHTYESFLDGNPFSPDVYRTDMTPIRVYKYTDGQNDYPFNGPGFFSVPTPPDFEPAGSAWFDFNRNYYTISPFERHSMQGFVAVQAHL